MSDISKIRNIGIIAHIDAGKTTTSERILFYTGKEHKMGEVDEGTTTMDYLEDERNRGITITSAATTCFWRDYRINLIDTPGHVDFTAEVERSLRVLDGAVGVFCAVAGVQAQSETVWRQADRYRVPRVAYVNKMDRVGARFDNVIKSIQNRLKSNPVAINLPWGEESGFCGIIDVLKLKGYQFDEASEGKVIIEKELPEELLEKAKFYQEELVNALADFDDSIIEKFSLGTLSIEDMKASLRRATLAMKITPVLAGSSYHFKGVQPLLDAVVDYLPSPMDVPPIEGLDKNDKAIKLHPSGNDELAALAFKSTFDKHGDLTYMRVYTGELVEGTQLYNATQKKVERINKLWYMHANKKEPCSSAKAGEIVAVVGLKSTFTGDTLCTKAHPVLLEKMKFPETVVSKAIEPKVSADKDRLLEALRIFSKDDPTFKFTAEDESGQILISGMGELHLEIVCSRMQKELNVTANVGKPRVSYRETIHKPGEAAYTFEKLLGGKNHYAHVSVQVQPSRNNTLVIDNRIKGQVPKLFINAIEEGIRSALTSGELSGYPVINVKATILDARNTPDSTEAAFNAAAFSATKNALQNGNCILLEPIMRLEVQTPIPYMGDVIANLGAKRAEIIAMDTQGEYQIIIAKVPIAEMFGYSDTLRSLTHGRGTSSMEPLEYAPAPKEVQEKVAFMY